MENKLLSRQEVPASLTWDLAAIYPSEEAYQQDRSRMKDLADHIAQTYPGTLTTPEGIVGCLKEYFVLRQIILWVGHYADLAAAVDYCDAAVQERSGIANRDIAQCSSKLSFIESEIIAQPESVIRNAMALYPEGSGYLSNLLRWKPHQLHPEAERVLAAHAGAMRLPYEAYDTAKLGDMDFPDFEADGQRFPLGYSLFEDDYEYDRRTEVRRTAFRTFSDKIRQYSKVTACLYNNQVQQEKVQADLRGFSSVFEYLLFGLTNIPIC